MDSDDIAFEQDQDDLLDDVYVSFLTNLDPAALVVPTKTGARKRKQQRSREHAEETSKEEDKEVGLKEEERDERREAYTPGWEHNLLDLEALPTKHGNKLVRRTLEKSRHQVDEGENAEQEVKDEEVESAANEAKQASAQHALMANLLCMQAWEARNFIAATCEDIVAGPEIALRPKLEEDNTKSPPKMDQLLHFMRHKDPHVQELVLLSLLMVFKNICPAYRIRLPTEKELAQRVKRDTKQLRDFERRLLMGYQRYLKQLSTLINTGLGNPTRKVDLNNVRGKLGLSALRCICELLLKLTHFNFRANLVELVVRRAAQPVPNVSVLCCTALEQLFASDLAGEASFECVRTTAKLVQVRKCDVPETLVRCFQHLKLAVHEDKARAVRKRAMRQTKKRKRDGENLNDELHEADATENTTQRARFQADALHEVTLTYLRVLKSPVGFKLVPTVLDGLAKIAHLINLETVQDLLAVLRNMLNETSGKIPLSVAVKCVRTALGALQGPGRELAVDVGEFVKQLYAILGDLPKMPALCAQALDCVNICFLQRGEFQAKRTGAFVKRLLAVASHLQAPFAEACLATAHVLLTRCPPARSLLETEGESMADGSLNLHIDDADNANALASPAWELSLYIRHIDPHIAAAASHLAKQVPFRPTDMADAVLKRFDDLGYVMQAMDAAKTGRRCTGHAKAHKIKRLKLDQSNGQCSRGSAQATDMERVRAALRLYMKLSYSTPSS